MPDSHQAWRIGQMSVGHGGRADVRKEKYMEEYIKRKDALDVFSKHMFAGYRGNGKSFFSEIVMPTFYCAIEDLPAADVRENKHGKWIENNNGTYSCSLCQSWIPKEQYYYARYCLHCGADMRGKIE